MSLEGGGQQCSPPSMPMKHFSGSLLAVALAMSQTAVVDPVSAEWHRIADPESEIVVPDRECRPGMQTRNPCHIHRRETFDRLPKNDPVLMDEHARKEYIEFFRKRERERQTPSAPKN